MTFPTLYVIRHGECVHNVERRVMAQSDSALTALGREQARANGRLLKEIAADLPALDFVASPLHRSCVTMELLREAAGLDKLAYRCDRRLMEIDFGDQTGLTYEEIDSAGEGRFGAGNWDYVRPNGESLAMVHARIGAFLKEISRDAVLVTHAGPLRMIRMHALGLTRGEALDYHPRNAGIMRLSAGSEAFFGE